MFHLAAKTSLCALGDEFLFSTFMRQCFDFLRQKTGVGGTPPPPPSGPFPCYGPASSSSFSSKVICNFYHSFLVQMLMRKIHSARHHCIMLFLANTWPLLSYFLNQELMWSVWTSAVTRHCTMLLEWTVKPLWWWAFKQPSSQGFHSLLLREKSWEPVCF